MRIALVSEFYYPHLGGVTEHVQNLAEQFRALGHEALIVTSHVPGHEPGPEPHVRRIGTSRVVYANGSFARLTVGRNLVQRLAALFRAERIDVVHAHGGLVPTLCLLSPRAARRVGIPVVGTFHSWFPRSAAYRTFRRLGQREMDGFSARIAVSQPVVDALTRYFRSDFDVIPNGVDVDYFQPNGRRPEDALRRGPRLLFLGRLDPRNGLDTMLEAMPRILEAYPSAELTVVGDGPLRAHYRRRARHLERAVRFVGRVYEERAEYYAKADLYVCPTQRASFGITLLEAMACATPMVVSDIIGFRELVDGGAEALLVPPDDPEAWASAVTRLVGNPELRGFMGGAGLAKAATYAWPLVARQVLGVYERVLG